MGWKRSTACALAALALGLAAIAGFRTDAAMAAQTKTLKEQLSDKASDDQRVDNCQVPPERRGPQQRPDCAAAQVPPPPAAGQGAPAATMPVEPGQ